MSNVIPFKCNKCNCEFSELEGGICSMCSKIYCYLHLKRNKRNGLKFVCDDCFKKLNERNKSIDEVN